MSIFEYDEQREIELIRRDEREIGKEIGERIGIEKERQNTEKEREKAIRSIVQICKRYGNTQQQAIVELQENYKLTEEQAKEKVALYWK